MPNAFFRFTSFTGFRDRYGIFIEGNGEPNKARKALAAAARNRRSKVKFNQEGFIPYISSAFIRLGSEVTYTSFLDGDSEIDFIYVIDNAEETPMLRIVSAEKDQLVWAGPFFQFLLHGTKPAPRRGMRPGTNPIILRRQRQERFETASNSQGGQETKFYTEQQKRLQIQQKEIALKAGHHELRKVRRRLVKKLGKRQQQLTSNIGIEPETIPYFGPPKDSDRERD